MSTGQDTHPQGSILRGLMRSPLFKDILRTNLNGMDPAMGSSCVKTFMTEDPEVFLSIAGSMPNVINTFIRASTELASELKDKYPPEMLKAFLASLAEDIDKDGLRQCGRLWAELAASLWDASPELRQACADTLLEKGPMIKAGAINGLARFVNETTIKDPEAVSSFISAMLMNIDRKEVGKATHTLAGAFLDQKWGLASWVWQLVKNRVRKRLNKL